MMATSQCIDDDMSDNNCQLVSASVKCRRVGGDSDDIAQSQTDTATSSVTAAASQQLDRQCNDSSNDDEADTETLTQGRRRAATRTSTSPLSQVSPKRRKLERPTDSASDHDT